MDISSSAVYHFVNLLTCQIKYIGTLNGDMMNDTIRSENITGHDDDDVVFKQYLYATHLVCTVLSYASAVSIFYKRTFSTDMVTAVVHFISLGMTMDFLVDVENPESVDFFLSICMCMMVLLLVGQHKRWIYSAKVYIAFAVIADYKLGLMNIIGVNISLAIKIVLVAIPQFIRQPEWLKAKLQPIRSNMGPVFVLYIVLNAFGYNSTTQEFYKCEIPAEVILRIICALLALFAGILYRPDNSVVISLFHKGTTTRSRKKIHGMCMILSLLLSLLLAL